MPAPEPFPETQPRFPSPGTHTRRALDMLRAGQALTSLEFQAATGSWKLAARVDELRHRYGWPVITALVPNPQRPQAKAIARYSLPSEAVTRYALHS